MCVFLLYVLIVLKLCIFFFFSYFLHCVIVDTMFAGFLIVYFVYDSYNNNNRWLQLIWLAYFADRQPIGAVLYSADKTGDYSTINIVFIIIF